MNTPISENVMNSIPKAELHIHLEGSIEPATLVELAARHGVALTPEETAPRYAPGDFDQFIQNFIWITSFLRTPEDYALIAQRYAESMRRQNVLYAEVTLSIGVMFRRNQDPAENFAALRDAAAKIPGVKLKYIFDAVRQWGAAAAMEVARIATELRSPDIVAYGIGGDELGLPTQDLKPIYDYVASQGMHRLIHAGEIGGPDMVRESVEMLGVDRIDHGISIMRDERTMDFIGERNIPLDVCPTSNLRTGALARQLKQPTASYDQHPLPLFIRRGLPVTLSSDDPAMFETTVTDEYLHAQNMGLTPGEIVQLAEASFLRSFLPAEEKQSMLDKFHATVAGLSLV
ncbi:MAG TPA: adenosine deaminase [Candidatus Acidoferrales bacterium]|jgi:adenosine deaminase|nr:adenosine deaminase [Candidatus Acidoferrales bacterium]